MTVKQLRSVLETYPEDAEVVVLDARTGEARVEWVAPYSTQWKREPVEDDGDWEGGIAPNAPVLLTGNKEADAPRSRFDKAMDWVVRHD
jgi:hypothetical protein